MYDVMNNKVAILVSGQRRDFDTKNFQKYILNELSSADVFFCMDDNSDINITNRYFTNDEFETTRTDIHPQFQRNNHCYNFMKTKGKYDFVIKTRPDMIYFDKALPAIDSWPKDALQVRSRIVSEEDTKNCERSWWPSDVRSYDMVDDQLFICPNSLAEQVFSTSMGNAKCQTESNWPECQFQGILDKENVSVRRTCMNVVLNKHQSSYPLLN